MSVFLSKNEIKRAERIINYCLRNLNIDLSGLTVLTEVGSGYFSLTPIIALLANAKKVYAWTRDSKYGSAEDVVLNCENIISTLNIKKKIEFAINVRPFEHVTEADIITNSGFVRPLDENLLKNVTKEKVVIPLMYEKWEWREGEIDKEFCDKKGILIGGTWENYGLLRIFDYCGHLAAKLCFEAGVEIFNNKVIIWSDDNFGEVVGEIFTKLGVRQVIKTLDANILYENISDADFIFFCDYHDKRQLLGKNGILEIDKIRNKNPSIKIIHLLGKIDADFLKKQSTEVYPEKNGYAQTMTYTLAYLGMQPLIKLQAGGLKVAECLYHGIENPICQRI
jgi:hypothetical protein